MFFCKIIPQCFGKFKELKNYLRNSLLCSLVWLIAACGDSSMQRPDKLNSESKEVRKNNEFESKSALNIVDKEKHGTTDFSKTDFMSNNPNIDKDSLKNLKPISQASLKAWLPENIDQYKRTYYATGDMVFSGVVSFKSIFTNQLKKEKVVQIEVMDGAGSGIAGMFVAGLQQNLNSEIEEETEDSYKKVVERSGVKAMEEQNNKFKSASLKFIRNDRFHFKLTGRNVSAEELWIIAGKLKPIISKP